MVTHAVIRSLKSVKTDVKRISLVAKINVVSATESLVAKMENAMGSLVVKMDHVIIINQLK